MKRWLATNARLVKLASAAMAGFLVLAVVVLQVAPDLFAETDGLTAKEQADARQNVRTVSLALLAGMIGVVGAIYTARSFALNRAGQLTDLFTKAIDQLGHKEPDVRLGGIYALERIARDSPEDHRQVVEVLSAYVREHAPSAAGARSDPPPVSDEPIEKWASPATDVQAALTVLGRRVVAHEQADRIRMAMVLSETDLDGAVVPEANFARVTFGDSYLCAAILVGADLRGAFLTGTDLRRAFLDEADLRGAHLHGADLTRARLGGARLEGALYDAATKWPDGINPEAAGARLDTPG